MEQIRTLNIDGTRESLQQLLVGSSEDERLREGLGAVAADLIARAKRAPLSVYMCSAEADSEVRNYLAFSLAKAIKSHVDNVLVVDCDFLSVGLNNLVPESDALGFLDLLLYGSSLDVITQQSSVGVKVIGAGSFPVSRKSPFVMDAFEETVRYLVNHARIVIFCGPALDDDDNVHPVADQVDLRVLVRSARPKRPNALDPMEEKVAAAVDGETWAVRVAESTVPKSWGEPRQAPPRPAEPPEAPVIEMPPEPPETPPVREEARVRGEESAGARDAAPAEAPPEWDEVKEVAIDRRSGGSSMFPRLVITTITVLLVVFVAYWLYLTRSIREDVDGPMDLTEMAVPAQQAGPAAGPGATADTTNTGSVAAVGDTAATDTAKTSPEQTTASAEQTTTPPPAEPTSRPATQPTSQGAPSLLEQLSDYAGLYVIHVSSFRRHRDAESDAAYLQGRGYETIIAQVDLGEKGIWYRVYVGPFETREEAGRIKIRLDENPRVRSTRLTRVPG
jgi:cell division septation protein DedD